MLRHTHIIRKYSFMVWECTIVYMLRNAEFLGANEFDDRPFLVMPYMKNGNARDYVQAHPECDRVQIV